MIFPRRPRPSIVALAAMSNVTCTTQGTQPAGTTDPVGAETSILSQLPSSLQVFVARYNDADPLGLRGFVREFGEGDESSGTNTDEVSFAHRWLRAHQIVGPIAVLYHTILDDGSIEFWGRGRVTRAWMGVRATLGPHQGLTELRVFSTDRPAQAGPPTRLPVSEVRGYVRDYFRALSERELFSGAYRLSHRGQLVDEAAFGMRDLNRLERITVDTRFDIASVSKVLVTLCVLRLGELGELSLDDTVGKFVGGYPAAVAEEVR